MNIRKARMEELAAIDAIYANARAFMRKTGNKEQWAGGYPSKEIIRGDIASERLFVCEEDKRLLGVFYFHQGEDPTYGYIEGKWLNDRPYGVMHRVAVAEQGRGVASFCYDYCVSVCGNLKIDTHRDNLPMQRSLEKNGFIRCGTIYLENGDPRIAFQKYSE
jgi:RimJ/RimL family protein N-acetyltransferase